MAPIWSYVHESGPPAGRFFGSMMSLFCMWGTSAGIADEDAHLKRLWSSTHTASTAASLPTGLHPSHASQRHFVHEKRLAHWSQIDRPKGWWGRHAAA